MRRVAPILLALAVAVLGSGALEHVHNEAHAAEDAAAAAQASAHAHGGHEGEPHPAGEPDPAGHEHPPAPLHDDSNCFLHGLLSLPMLAAGFVPLLVWLGLFVAFLTLLAPRPVYRRPTSRIVCRGPPAAPPRLVPSC